MKSLLSLIAFLGIAHGQTQAPTQKLPNLLGLPGLDCIKTPAIDPSKDFLANFNNSCYAMPLSSSRGGEHAGDLNARYGLVFYKVTPGYELVLTGTYPNARFFSVTVYDSHSAETAAMTDSVMPPLNSSMINPFRPNTSFVPNQQYGMTIGFGAPPPVNVSPGCSTSDTTIDSNFLDASQIHQGISWNGYPGLPQGFPVHLTGASVGGSIIVRSYYDISQEPSPSVIVRDLSTGCAVPLKNTDNIITTDVKKGGSWGDTAQTSAHDQFAYSIQPSECFPQDPQNGVQWNRSADYIPGYNEDAAYLAFYLSRSKVQSIASGHEFIRMRFQLPKMPDTPCTTGACALNGSEELRYRSISFLDKTQTLASLKDADFVQDANGNVTLIIGYGTKPPAYVTAANNYTYFDLSSVPNYRNLQSVTMRDILPNPGFQCSNFNVPFLYTEYNPEGGYMGNYVPTVDFPTATEIPTVAVPIVRPNSCPAVVSQLPVACAGQ
jgi:hypothetical protein